MSTTTTRIRINDLQFMVTSTTAGVSATQLAVLLNDRGVELPRDAAFDHRHAPASGYNIDNGTPGNPSRWTAQAVTRVLATPEADPASNYAAARAHGSDTTTPLTIT